MPPPRPATEARSGSLEPGQPSRARSANTRHPAGRPHMPPADRIYATDVRQHHHLMPPGRGHNNLSEVLVPLMASFLKGILVLKVVITYSLAYNSSNTRLMAFFQDSAGKPVAECLLSSLELRIMVVMVTTGAVRHATL